MFNTSDIIVATASPPGRSVRGIVRLSGTGVDALLMQCVSLAGGEPLPWRRGMARARVRYDEHSLPALVLCAPGPNSYTGEDSAEVQLPGNPMVLQHIVDAFIQAGNEMNRPARRAEGGEFTARAFFNGRVSLTEAEGVNATIIAQSDAELRAAHMLTGGSLGRFAHEKADELADALALLEAGIDFTDQEDVVAITPNDLYQRLVSLREAIDQQLNRAIGMEQLRAIPWVVLTGKPNAGKSTLFNALLGRQRVVVSDMAGTTRDVITEPMTIETGHGKAEIMLVDLAGDDETQTTINEHMQAAAREAAQRAELIVHCVEPGEQPIVSDQRRTPRLIVRTKADQPDSNCVGEDEIAVSAARGTGLDELRRVITEMLSERAISLSSDLMALQPRHESALREAESHLAEAIALVEPLGTERSLDDPELVAAAMRAALDEMAGLAGDITPDDVLGRVFARFCVGK